MIFKSFISYFKQLIFHDFDARVIRKISKIKGVLVARNGRSDLYMKYNELAGYKYVSVQFTGKYNIESNKRCSILFIGKHDELVITSDTDYIKGDYGERMDIGLTKFDFDLEEYFIEFINSNTLKRIQLNFENGVINHKTQLIDYQEIDQPRLINELGSLDQ